MPLLKGVALFGENVRELMRKGLSEAQAIAAAMRHARDNAPVDEEEFAQRHKSMYAGYDTNLPVEGRSRGDHKR